MSEQNTKGAVVRFMLRLPVQLDREITEDAQRSNRSKNNYISQLLDKNNNLGSSASDTAEGDADERALLKWFRGLPERQRIAFLGYLAAGEDD